MKVLTLNVLAFYFSILALFAQTTDTGYAKKKLTVSEVNLVSGYYNQAGSHSAVTGGVGTEKLTDISNTIDVKLIRFDKRQREHNLNVELGIDYYTSASSDKIDPSTITSASYADKRFYPTVGYSIKNAATGVTKGISASFSSEYDYVSKGIGFSFNKASKDNNREWGVKLQAYLDSWKVILPIELRTPGRDSEGYEPRNSYSASFNFSQVVNPHLQFTLLADVVRQNGLLATSYQRVYFKNAPVTYERLPDTRFKLPIGLRANYFVSDAFIIRSFYRFYTDDWGVRAHTVELETPVKLNPYFSISPFYRFYTQSAADYFAPYAQHQASELFYTSDYDLSKFNSHFFGAGFRAVPVNGVLGLKRWKSVELRYGRYTRNTDLQANIVSLHLKFQ